MDDAERVEAIRKKQQKLRSLLEEIQGMDSRRYPIKALVMLNRARKMDQELKKEIKELTKEADGA